VISHARKCANLVQDKLGPDYIVSSFVKPGAQMSEITTTASEEIKSLKSDDVIVWGGIKDIGKNNTKEAMKYVLKFVNENKDKNIVLINSPQRHDLIPTSCVNKEVLNCNTQLGKVTRLQPNVKLFEIKLVRNQLTRHGLHLNPKGKKLISQELAMIVDQFFKQTKKIPYPHSKEIHLFSTKQFYNPKAKHC